MRALENNELSRIAGGMMKHQSVLNDFAIAGATPSDNSEEPQDVQPVQVTANVSSSHAGEPFGAWGAFIFGSPGPTSPPGEFDKIGSDDGSGSDWSADGDIHVEPNGDVDATIHLEGEQDEGLDLTIGHNILSDSTVYEIHGYYDGLNVDFTHNDEGNEYSGGYTLANGVHISFDKSTSGDGPEYMLTISSPL